MIPLRQIESEFEDFRLFRTYFTPWYLAKESLSYPLDYFFKKGRSSSISNIDLTLTSRCNLNCSVCYYRPELNRRHDELSCEEIGSLLDSVSNKPFVFLGGGEPLLRPDILRIIGLVKKRDLYCAICTNGVLLDKKIAGLPPWAGQYPR